MRDLHAFEAFKIDRPLVLFLEDWIDQINSEAAVARSRGRDVSRSTEFVAVIQAVLDKHYEEMEMARGAGKPASATTTDPGTTPAAAKPDAPTDGAIVLNFMAYQRKRTGVLRIAADHTPAA